MKPQLWETLPQGECGHPWIGRLVVQSQPDAACMFFGQDTETPKCGNVCDWLKGRLCHQCFDVSVKIVEWS